MVRMHWGLTLQFLAQRITGVAFANGGKIETAELPAISSLTARNLNHLTDLKISGYANITALVVENCATIDLKDMLAKCTNLSRVRLIGLDWQMTDTKLLEKLYAMTGTDENGYNTDHSVLAGKVHLPTIRQKELERYNAQWPDLKVSYNTLIEQFAWTFVNKDGTILDVQYIDKGGKAVDPITRKENPIPTPTAESTVSTDFTFKGWDTEFTTVFGNQTVTALYTESVRKYTVRYLNRGAVLKSVTVPYGTAQWVDDKDTTYGDATQSAHGLMTAADKTKLDGIAAGANKYIHPSYTAAAAGLYKVTVDASGHVSATTAVAKSDITALGIPSTNTTYSAATQSANGLMSAADKKKLDGFGAASSYATMTYVGQQISAAGHISKSIVETLPAVKDAKDNIIYMIKKATPDGSNLYDEYMLISGALEKIGDTKTVIDEITNEEIDAILAS